MDIYSRFGEVNRPERETVCQLSPHFVIDRLDRVEDVSSGDSDFPELLEQGQLQVFALRHQRGATLATIVCGPQRRLPDGSLALPIRHVESEDRDGALAGGLENQLVRQWFERLAGDGVKPIAVGRWFGPADDDPVSDSRELSDWWDVAQHDPRSALKGWLEPRQSLKWNFLAPHENEETLALEGGVEFGAPRVAEWEKLTSSVLDSLLDDGNRSSFKQIRVEEVAQALFYLGWADEERVLNPDDLFAILDSWESDYRDVLWTEIVGETEKRLRERLGLEDAADFDPKTHEDYEELRDEVGYELTGSVYEQGHRFAGYLENLLLAFPFTSGSEPPASLPDVEEAARLAGIASEPAA